MTTKLTETILDLECGHWPEYSIGPSCSSQVIRGVNLGQKCSSDMFETKLRPWASMLRGTGAIQLISTWVPPTLVHTGNFTFQLEFFAEYLTDLTDLSKGITHFRRI